MNENRLGNNVPICREIKLTGSAGVEVKNVKISAIAYTAVYKKKGRGSIF